MKRQNTFYTYKFNYIYSTGALYSKYNFSYFFPLAIDIFNTEAWLKEKITVFENKRLIKFKDKFSKRNN